MEKLDLNGIVWLAGALFCLFLALLEPVTSSYWLRLSLEGSLPDTCRFRVIYRATCAFYYIHGWKRYRMYM